MAIRLGFIGTGGIAQGHMDRLTQMEGVEAAAHCDVLLERAEQSAAKFGGQAFDDYRRMLDAVQLEGVVICTPPFAHGDIEAACCDLGLHLLLEKPVAINTDVARRVQRRVEESGVATVVAYKYRWDDHVNKAREMLRDKAIGLAVGSFWGGLPGTPWWRVMAESGGQMVEQTTHIVDMARYLVGDVKTVQAFYALRGLTEVPDLDVPDVGTVNLVFESGAVGNISNTCMLSGWGTSGLRVMAKGFTLEVVWGRLTWNAEGEAGEYQQQTDGYQGEDEAFVAAIRGDRSKVNSDYADGAKSLAVSYAANVSAERGGEVVAVGDI